MEWVCKYVSLLLVFTLGLSSLSLSSPPSEQEFESLLKHHAYNLPELKSLWGEVANTQIKDQVYLSGGVLRGLIQWVDRMTRVYGVQATFGLHTPSADQLLLQEWSDTDLIAPRQYSDWINQRTLGHWDILDPSFMRDSTLSGGVTLEKVGVNPFGKIYDPENAIRDYLQGKLVFRKPSNNQVSPGQLRGNTQTAQALRFLRMAQNMQYVKPTPESMMIIQGLAADEIYRLQRGGDEDYWVLKSLKKLYQSTHRDTRRFLQTLKSAGLLSLLAAYHYSLTLDENQYKYFEHFVQNEGKTWTDSELFAAAEVLGSNAREKKENFDVVLRNRNTSKAQSTYQHRWHSLSGFNSQFGENELFRQRAQPIQHLGPNPGRVLANGAVEFQLNVPVEIRINGVLQQGCQQLLVKVGIGRPIIHH